MAVAVIAVWNDGVRGSQPSGVVSGEPLPIFTLDHRWSLREPGPLSARLGQPDDSGLPRDFSSGASVSALRNWAGIRAPGQWYPWRRVAEPSVALPNAPLSAPYGETHNVALVSWPMGQSAAESVVLLQRLRR